MTAPTPLAVALHGLCPRCGARTLFAGVVRFAARCGQCGLDFSAFNVGDGPAAILTLVVGAIVVGLAVWLEVAVAPSWWVHLLLWPVLTLGLTVGSLRVAKAALLALEYANDAREGRGR